MSLNLGGKVFIDLSELAKKRGNMINVYFNCLIDTESHPEIAEITTKKAMLEIAAKLTTNKVSPIDWESGCYLVFSEIIQVDETSEENQGYSIEAIINNLSPQCPDAEYSTHRRVKLG